MRVKSVTNGELTIQGTAKESTALIQAVAESMVALMKTDNYCAAIASAGFDDVEDDVAVSDKWVMVGVVADSKQAAELKEYFKNAKAVVAKV